MNETECQGESCCATLPVPKQTFTLGGTVEKPTSAAMVSPYSLDEYKVTIARFLRFLEDFDAWRARGNPLAGAGAHPLIAGSGWQSEWPLAASAAEIRTNIECSFLYQTVGNATLDTPLNCVSWLEASAFCIWDGQRLPTEAEWECAASGGDRGWAFPWGTTDPEPNRAVYDCQGDGSAVQDCARSDILPVGSRPAGAGRWGHRDLAGLLMEWAFDWYAYYPATANDWANLSTPPYRSIRGSVWYSAPADLRAPIRYNSIPTTRRAEVGFRCAHSL